MWTFIAAFCLINGLANGQPSSSCHDLDTQACIMFQQAKPDLCSDPAFGSTTCARFCGNCPIECYSCTVPVLDYNECNTTATCQPDETCMLKHLTAIDGHHEYIMSCEKKTICEGFGLGFAFGRRDVDDDDERSKRDVSLSCCHTDFCNFPVQTTTLPPTTTTLRSPCSKDIVFVLDDSGSVGSSNFRKSTYFVEQVVNNLSIGPTDAQVAVVTYSTHASVNWYLNAYPTKQSVLNALPNIHYAGGSTHTDEALQAVRQRIFTTRHGDRPSYDNVVILISDGVSTDKQQTLQTANLLHGETHDVITILVGTTSSDQAQMTAIATDRHHAFDIRSYSHLTDIVQQVISLICSP